MHAAALLERNPFRSSERIDALTLLAEIAVEQGDDRSAYGYVADALEANCDDLRLTNLAGTTVAQRSC